MLKNKRFLGILACLGLIGAASAQQPTVMRWGDVVAGGHPQVMMIERVAADVKAKTNGRIDIQGFPNGQMGSSRDMIEAVSNGTQQIVTEGAANFGAWIPSISVTEAPYIWKSPSHLINALNGPLLEKYNEQLIKARGMRILGAVYYGTRHLTTSNRPVKTVDDAKGLKVRVPENDVFKAMAESWGAKPTPMNFGELYLALKQGVVDGQENPISTFYPVKIHEYHKFVTDWHYVVDPTLFVVNPGVWGSFSAEDQKMIQEADVEAGKYQIALARIGLDDGTAQKYLEGIGKVPEITDWYGTLKSVGMDVAILTPEETKAFADKTAPVLEAWRSKVGEELVKAAEADMAAAVKK